MRSAEAAGVTRRAAYSACVGAWGWLSLSLALPLCGAEAKLQVPDLPTEAGKSVAIGLSGLSSGAKRLELLLVPGRGSVKPFFMGKYEVTQGQYEALMATNPSDPKSGADYPVEQVSWDDAKEFCRRLTAGLPGKLKGKFVFRLPTDTEWSIAAGLPEESGRTPSEKIMGIKDVYPWGTIWPPPSGAGNYCDETTKGKESTKGKYDSLIRGYNDGFLEAAPVGRFKPNRYGLCDLGGNVWEWCEDFYYPEHYPEPGFRTLRGASWALGNSNCLLSSFRDSGLPDSRRPSVGFRCVLAGASSPLSAPDLPTEAGKSVTLGLPGLTNGAKQL